MKALIVEDDIEIQELIEYFFTKENYEIYKTSDGLEALKLTKKNKPDIVILDLMIPSLDGSNVAKIIKNLPEEYGYPKIIMVTAKTEIEDVLSGLEIGADDYLKKPFDPRELVLRVKKILGNKINIEEEKKENEEKYKLGDIEVNNTRHAIYFEEKEVEFSKKEYDLLLLLIKNKNLVVTRERILDEVWNSNYYTGDRTVDVYISKIREKIPELSTYIKTVKGVGYKLEEKK